MSLESDLRGAADRAALLEQETTVLKAEVERQRGLTAEAEKKALEWQQRFSVQKDLYDALVLEHADCPPKEEPEEPTPTKGTTRVGMSAPKNLWDQRIREVGKEGVTARRIFCKDISIDDQKAVIERAIADGMVPILSHKGVPTPEKVQRLREQLLALKVPVYSTYWHEPRGDMTPAEFVARSKIFTGVKAPTIKVGPILNGFLLDRESGRTEWEQYSDAGLRAAWDFIGMDVYQAQGGGRTPGSRVAPMLDWLKAKGIPDKEVLIGEYNSFLAESIRSSGMVFLGTPNIKVFCAWNSTGPEGSQEHVPLDGERLEAFIETKKDPRVIR